MPHVRKLEAGDGRDVFAVVEDVPDDGFRVVAWLGRDPTIADAITTLQERLRRGRELQLEYGLRKAPASLQMLNEHLEKQLEHLEQAQRDTGLP